jgi:hypothetical protein
MTSSETTRLNDDSKLVAKRLKHILGERFSAKFSSVPLVALITEGYDAANALNAFSGHCSRVVLFVGGAIVA